MIMNQMERLDFLIESFKPEANQYSDLEIPESQDEKRDVLRALMNVRMPGELPPEVLRVQDEYLAERALEKGIVGISDIATLDKDDKLLGKISIWKGDITRLAVDAIVNAANSKMLGCFAPLHACIDNAIHTFAGTQLRLECHRKMQMLRRRFGESYEQPMGVPMLTDAYNLPSKHVIHVVGPIVDGELTTEHEADLESCYINSLNMCLENDIRSIAFCCISTGVFHFPNERAAEIAVGSVENWLMASKEHEEAIDRVIFNVFKDADLRIYNNILGGM